MGDNNFVVAAAGGGGGDVVGHCQSVLEGECQVAPLLSVQYHPMDYSPFLI